MRFSSFAAAIIAASSVSAEVFLKENFNDDVSATDSMDGSPTESLCKSRNIRMEIQIEF